MKTEKMQVKFYFYCSIFNQIKWTFQTSSRVGRPERQPLKLWRKKKSFSGRKEKKAAIFVESLKKDGGGLMYRNMT